MNLLTSYDWLKEYVDLGAMTAEEFAARISLSGPGVERLHPQGKEWDKVVLGHVLEVKPHPNADKLRLAVTDIGSKKATIVCGGSNLAQNQWVAVALAGAVKGADPDQITVRMGIFVGLGALALWLSQLMLHTACKAG